MKNTTKATVTAAILFLSLVLSGCTPSEEEEGTPASPAEVSLTEESELDEVFEDVNLLYLNSFTDDETVKVTIPVKSILSLQTDNLGQAYTQKWGGVSENENVATFTPALYAEDGTLKAYAYINGEAKGKTTIVLNSDTDITVTLKVVVQ